VFLRLPIAAALSILAFVTTAQAEMVSTELLDGYVIDLPSTFTVARPTPLDRLDPSGGVPEIGPSARFQQILMATGSGPGVAFITVNYRPSWDSLYPALEEASPDTWRVIADAAGAPLAVMVGRAALITGRGEPIVTAGADGEIVLSAQFRAQLCQERCEESVLIHNLTFFRREGTFEVAFAVSNLHPSETEIVAALQSVRLAPVASSSIP
jgi:hypothetical protein